MSASTTAAFILLCLLVPAFLTCYAYSAVSSGLPAEDANIANLVDCAAASDAYLTGMKNLLTRLQGGLSTLCPRLMKAGEETPRSLSDLAEYFYGDKDPLRNFSSERTRQGAGLAFGQLIAHGLEEDVGRSCSSKAVDESGKEVEPSLYSSKGVEYAKLLGLLIRGEKKKKKSSSAAASSAATNV